MNQEFPFSDRGTAAEDKQYTFRLPTKRAALFGEMGIDGVTLANNHALDFGQEALLDSLPGFGRRRDSAYRCRSKSGGSQASGVSGDQGKEDCHNRSHQGNTSGRLGSRKAAPGNAGSL